MTHKTLGPMHPVTSLLHKDLVCPTTGDQRHHFTCSASMTARGALVHFLLDGRELQIRASLCCMWTNAGGNFESVSCT